MRTTKRALISLLVIVGGCVGAPARAHAVSELRYDLRLDVPIATMSTVLWLGTEAFKSHFAPAKCKWCDRNADGSDGVNGLDASVRNALKWGNIDAGDRASNVFAYGLLPVTVLGLDALAANHDQALRGWPTDALLILEATAIAGDLNQLVKFSAGRERPFVHVLPEDQKSLTAAPADNNVSFYSGHTNFAFALVVSAGTIATMRGYKWAKWIWIAGLIEGVATGYLRIAGDRHYFTDVMTGAIVGSAVGFAVPYFFHRAQSESSASSSGALGLTSAPVPGGQVVGVNLAF